MNKLKIGIIGSRGIPNNYGGYEQFAFYLSSGLVQRGHRVVVYNSHNHPYRENKLEAVEIVHCFDPEYLVGTAGQFIYDLNCILNARKQNFDILFFLGYTSSSVWGRLYPKSPVIINHMDGMEWKREKYRPVTRKFLKYAEKLAIKYSDFLISDSQIISEYLLETRKVNCDFISYGAEVFLGTDESIPDEYGVSRNNYLILIARMEPENNIETILNGYCDSKTDKPILVVGKTENKYSRYLQKKFGDISHVKFTGGIYNTPKLHSLRALSSLYFHGHSAGGTNPSLLEAMASGTLIAAHDNRFNRAVLGEDALYFRNENCIRDIISRSEHTDSREKMIKNNQEKIRTYYRWDEIVDRYEKLFIKIMNERNK